MIFSVQNVVKEQICRVIKVHEDFQNPISLEPWALTSYCWIIKFLFHCIVALESITFFSLKCKHDFITCTQWKRNVSVKTTIFEVKRWLKEMYFISLSHFLKSWNCKCPCQISVIMAAAPNKASSQLSQNDTEPSSNCEDNESVLRMLTIALQFRTTYWLSWMHNQSYFSPSTMNGAKII